MPRTPLCPICAAPLTWQAGDYVCSRANVWFRGGMAEALRQACLRAAGDLPIARAAPATYFVCPSCGSDLEDYSENKRFLECTNCAAKLPATVYHELKELQALHRKLG